jgi:hypothetical protein
MAAETRTPEQIRREIESEREGLAEAVDSLREGMNVTRALRPKLPVFAAGALGAGFVLAGGIGATMRLFMRKSREGETKARFGRFRLVDRD